MINIFNLAKTGQKVCRISPSINIISYFESIEIDEIDRENKCPNVNVVLVLLLFQFCYVLIPYGLNKKYFI